MINLEYDLLKKQIKSLCKTNKQKIIFDLAFELGETYGIMECSKKLGTINCMKK